MKNAMRSRKWLIPITLRLVPKWLRSKRNFLIIMELIYLLGLILVPLQIYWLFQ